MRRLVLQNACSALSEKVSFNNLAFAVLSLEYSMKSSYFPIQKATELFDLNKLQNLDILVTRSPTDIERFIRNHFLHTSFIAFDMEFQEGISVELVVDGVSTPMTTVNIASLQFGADGKALIVLVHNNG